MNCGFTHLLKYAKITLLSAQKCDTAQKKAQFISGLSIIDALMFNSPEQVNQMLDDYEIFTCDAMRHEK